MPTVQFDKPHKSLSEQVSLLQSRGLIINDTQKAQYYLEHLNYYRLSAYWIPYFDGHEAKRFKSGATFEDVLNLYTFDRELRLLILDAIERIEVSIRAKWAYSLAETYGAHAHLDSSLFKNSQRWKHSKAVRALEVKVSKSQEEFIVHLRNKYDEKLPPLWAMVEIMTFGELSHWYAKLNRRKDRNAISRKYNIDETNMVSFLHHLNGIRNICAHHNRLWNSNFTITLKLPRNRPQEIVSNLNFQATRKLYNTLVFLAYLMDCTSPRHHWKERLIDLLDKHQIDVKKMGFPENYRNLSIWSV
ncbi:MAG: Abi family protein [Cyanobacteria bacterium J06623_1]